MQYDHKHKPNPTVCPRHFCFLWQYNQWITKDDPEPQSIAEGCSLSGNSHALCARLDPIRGRRDYYEPHEPNLERAGLPWFYFISSPLELVKEIQEEYLAESEALWGEKHWEKETHG